MSKVIHLSDEAHNRAKHFCKERSLRMSDWVADLIEQAIADGRAAEPVPVPVLVEKDPLAKKKPLHRFEGAAKQPIVEEGVPAYAAPPFWARKK